MGRRAKYDIQSALADLRSGKTIRETAKKYGIQYGSMWHAARNYGISGGVRQRDMRSFDQKIRDAITIDPSGCWLWVGRDPRAMAAYTPGAPTTPRNVARYLLGLPARRIPYMPGQACGTRECINPEHEELGKFQERNKRIMERWRESEEAKTKIVTLEMLGQEFGLTRERIRQIIGETETSTAGTYVKGE